MIKYNEDEPTVISKTRSQTLEVFSDEDSIRRGIKRRFKYDIKDVLIYDAELIPSLQAGHKHTVKYEAFMLIRGEIIACHWDNRGKTKTKTLRQRGDMIAFPPGQSHTLLVKKESQVIVTRFETIDKMSQQDKWEPVSLPGNLQSLRDELQKTPDRASDIFKEIDQELARLEKTK